MRYDYEAVDATGNVLKGTLEAPSEAELQRTLTRQGLVVVALAAGQGPRAGALVRASRGVPVRVQAVVLRELATLLAAGVPLAEAVESMGSAHEGDVLGPAFTRVHASLRAGTPLSEAMRECGVPWPGFLHQLLEAGEMIGKLADSLRAAADQMDYEQRMRDDLRNALVYPAVLVFSGLAATLVIFVVVVPKFANMLKSSAGIPEISRWVLEAGLFARANLFWLGLAAAAVASFAALAWATPAVRRGLLEAAAGTPLLGGWLRDAQTGRWAMMLGTLLASKVPILQAMELARSGVTIGSLARALLLVQRDLRTGRKLAESLQAHGAVGRMGVNLVQVGERSGELAAMLAALGRIHEEAGRNRMKRFLTLLEPLAILIIGAVIGFIMIAVMLAITSLSSTAL